MPMYRKKPVVVEALLWDGRLSQPMFDFLTGTVNQPMIDHGKSFLVAGRTGPNGMDFLIIRTLEGDQRARVGDYIIRGAKGEFYVRKPGVFEDTYEPAE